MKYCCTKSYHISLGFHLVKGTMKFSSLIILGTISAFSNIAYCEEQAQLDQPLVDLELCLVGPTALSTGAALGF